MHKQKESFPEGCLCAQINIVVEKALEVLAEILSCLHPIAQNYIHILRVIFGFGKDTSFFDVDDRPVEVDFVEHDLPLLVIVVIILDHFLWFLLG